MTRAVGYVTLRPSLTRSIRKLQHTSREKDVCISINNSATQGIMSLMIYSTTKKYKDLHSIQRVKSVKIHVSASTARLEVIIEKKKINK